MVVLVTFIHLFYQLGAALTTERRLLPVGIRQAVGKVHDAFSIRAVVQPEGVPQLMDRLFEGPIYQKRFVRQHSIIFLSQLI